MKIGEKDMGYKLPAVGYYYQHKNGGLYQVTALANLAADLNKEEFPVTIIYLRLSDQTLWARTIDRWEGKFQKITPTYNELE